MGRKAGLLIVHNREGHVPDLSDCPSYKLERSRRAGAEIGSKGPLGRLLVRGEVGHDFVEALRPLEQEIVIDKPGYSAFAHTGLQQALTKRSIETLILTGATTEVCVSSTLRAAIDIGYPLYHGQRRLRFGQSRLAQGGIGHDYRRRRHFGEVATTAEVIERFT